MTKSTKWLIAVFLIGITAMIATRIANANHLGLEDHVPSGTLFLTLSIGLILLIGNIIVTEAWTFAAEKTKNETVMKFAVRTLN